MSTQTRLMSIFKEKLHLRALLRGKYALRSVVAILAIITMGGFLASGTHSIVAQEGEVEVQLIVVGGTIPVIVGEFDTAVFGSSVPTGIAYNTDTDVYAIVDSTDDEVYIVDRNGDLVSQFDTEGFGANAPQGIAYDSAADKYVIVDSTDDFVYSVNTDGTAAILCDIGSLGAFGGINQPTGVAFNSTNGNLAITDSTDDEVYIVTTACAFVASFDTFGDGATGILGITYRPDTDRYEVVGNNTDEFYIYDASAGGLGTLISQFDLGSSSITTPVGLAFNPDDRVSAILDNNWDQVFPIDHRGTLVKTFDTAILAQNNPSDLSFNTTTGRLIMSDDGTDILSFIDPATGLFTGFCSTVPAGADNVWGVAYLPSTDQLALADPTDDEVYITSTGCILASNFDTLNLEANAPSGLGVDLLFGDLTLVDNDDAIRYIDTTGNLKGHCDGEVLGFDGSGGGPIDGLFSIQDMAHVSAAGNFAVVDNSDDEVVVFDTLCLPVLHFDTRAFPSNATVAGNPEGIAVDNAAKRIWIVDSQSDEVYELDLPRVFEATTLSGSFKSTGGIVVNFKETGDGFISGEVILPGESVGRKLFGMEVKTHASGADVAAIFDRSALTLDIMTDLGAGPVTFSATVASDLNSFLVGPTLLTRQ